MLNIKLYYADGTGSITNKTTGEKFVCNTKMNGNHLTLSGVKALKASINILRDTNRKYISLVPGKNEIEITGLSYKKAEFDFPYYFK